MPSRLHDIVSQANDLAPSTRARYLSDLHRWIAFAGEDPAGWTRYRAAEFYRALLEHMKPQSANRLMASVAYASHWWAHYEGRPELDFAIVQTAPAADKKPQRALEQAEALALLSVFDRPTPTNQRDFALIVVGLETGMRRMSLLSMLHQHTHLVSDPGGRTSASVPRPPGYPATFVALKGKPAAWVPLSDTTILALTPWLHARGSAPGPLFVSLARRTNAKTGRNEWHPGTTPLSTTMIGQMLDQRCATAGLAHINPHMLRHTFVTWRTLEGAAPHQIAAITKHDLKGGIGAMGGYVDLARVGEEARKQTPPWFAAAVARQLERLL